MSLFSALNIADTFGNGSDGSGNYQIKIRETETSVGNPTVDYDVVRVR